VVTELYLVRCMLRVLRRWPIASVLIILHAIILVTAATLFYTSHEPERQWVWVYAIMAGYPSSLAIEFLPHWFLPYWGEATFATILLLTGTLQWGVVGAVVDSIVHWFSRKSALPHI
jgi:hypothetical protein